jgi:hypothetical protein
VRQAKQALVLIAHGGIALTSRLYWDGVRPALPIVLASGYVMSSDRLHGLDVIFLKKPYATAAGLTELRKLIKVESNAPRLAFMSEVCGRFFTDCFLADHVFFPSMQKYRGKFF